MDYNTNPMILRYLDSDEFKKNYANLNNLFFIDQQVQGGKSICWTGYHRVKGTKPYSKHSCKKN